MIAILHRLLKRRQPDPALTHAIKEHEAAVEEAAEMNRAVSALATDLRRNAAQAVAILERTWQVSKDATRN